MNRHATLISATFLCSSLFLSAETYVIPIESLKLETRSEFIKDYSIESNVEVGADLRFLGFQEEIRTMSAGVLSKEGDTSKLIGFSEAEVLGLEDVRTQDKVYKDCVKLQVKTCFNRHGYLHSTTESYWLAKGVGAVKLETQDRQVKTTYLLEKFVEK